MLALIRKGLTREEAYARVQGPAMEAWAGGGDFQAKLAADPEVGGLLGTEELARCFDLAVDAVEDSLCVYLFVNTLCTDIESGCGFLNAQSVYIVKIRSEWHEHERKCVCCCFGHVVCT